jgi:hypothetical protein
MKTYNFIAYLGRLLFADIEQGRLLEAQIRKAYGVDDLDKIGLRIEGRGTIVTDPAKVTALESHKKLQEKARRLFHYPKKVG